MLPSTKRSLAHANARERGTMHTNDSVNRIVYAMHDEGHEDWAILMRAMLNRIMDITNSDIITLNRDERLAEAELEVDLYQSRCPACGDAIDYCIGHGEIGDPSGYLTLKMHDRGVHIWCHERARCDDTDDLQSTPIPVPVWGRDF